MMAAMDVMGIFDGGFMSGGKIIDAKAEIQEALNILHEIRENMKPECQRRKIRRRKYPSSCLTRYRLFSVSRHTRR
jgi:hypothetical protein